MYPVGYWMADNHAEIPPGKCGIFADCSGDSVLAPITGAPFRTGRESCYEFQESIEPEKQDSYTMGLSCMFQVEERREESEFIPRIGQKNRKESANSQDAGSKKPYGELLVFGTGWNTRLYWRCGADWR